MPAHRKTAGYWAIARTTELELIAKMSAKVRPVQMWPCRLIITSRLH